MLIRDRIKGLRRVKASELRPNPKNWRTHPKAQREALQGLLAEIGYADALLARELPDGSLQLIDGHLRAETTPEQEVPVLILDLDEKEAEKLLVSLDPLAAMAGQNDDLLRELLAGIETESAALKDMWADLAVPLPGEGLTDPDAVPEPPEEPVTRPGDLWVLGDHRLLCGDSSKAEDVDRLLAGAPVHLVNADPPYNVRVEPRSNNAIAAGLSSFTQTHHQGLDLARHPEKAKPTSRMRPKDRPLANDFVSDEAFAGMLLAWFGNMSRVLVPGGSFYVWGGYANCGNYPPALKASGLYFSQTIIWNKLHPVLTRKDFMGAHEWCFYGWREGAAHRFFGPANVPDLWDLKKVNPQSMVHLTQKPTELAVRAIQYSSREGENVLDLFGGSGSTLIAAQQTKRRAYLMEIDPAYCDVILQRFRDFTGKDAVREDGTGGFLVEAFEHLKKQVKTTKDRERLQRRTLFGGEAKPLPYLLAEMNLLLHGVEVPNIEYGNSLAVKLGEIGDKDRVDVVLTNPPFGGEEEAAIKGNFPSDLQTSETALLFLQLIMRKLRRPGHNGRPGGRAAVVVPNGTLFGDGVCARIKEQLLKEFNLHTIVRLPNGVFAPYTAIPTNLLFFERSVATTDVWYYEQALPEGRKQYTKTQPLQFEEFAPCLAWWEKREETDRAWRVSAAELLAGGCNLDRKNPRGTPDLELLPPEQLVESILEKERKIIGLLADVKGLLNEKS